MSVRARAGHARALVGAGALLIAVVTPVDAGPVYQWKDENGNAVFSERRPPPDRGAEVVKLRSGKPAADAAAQLEKSRLRLAPPTKKDEAARPPLTPEQQARRSSACVQARRALETLQTTNRPRYQADDGQLVVMDDALKAARIADAEQKIGDYCDD